MGVAMLLSGWSKFYTLTLSNKTFHVFSCRWSGGLDPKLAIILQILLTEQTASKGETDDAPDTNKVCWCMEEIFGGVAALDLCHAAGRDHESIRFDLPIVPASD